jgi:thiamine biosynthesis lipoprotein
LFDILSDCIDAHKKTHGLFDITINSPDHSTESIKKVELFSDLKAVQILDNDTILDINGYVKGYAADKIRDLILTTSVKNALINLGNSSVLGVGDHPFGKGWKLKGLANAVTDITLYNECLTTSGNIVAERKHIRHPVSHEFISGERTISVVTPTGSLGEILSTSFLLATKEQALKISEQFKLSGKCLISSTG